MTKSTNTRCIPAFLVAALALSGCAAELPLEEVGVQEDEVWLCEPPAHLEVFEDMDACVWAQDPYGVFATARAQQIDDERYDRPTGEYACRVECNCAYALVATPDRCNDASPIPAPCGEAALGGDVVSREPMTSAPFRARSFDEADALCRRQADADAFDTACLDVCQPPAPELRDLVCCLGGEKGDGSTRAPGAGGGG